MSALGFEVHIDKENDTPVPGMINKGGPLKHFGREAKGKVQPTPRKALYDVNQEPANAQALRNLGRNKLDSSSTVLRDGCTSTFKPLLKVAKDAENDPLGAHNKKQDSKKTPAIQKKELKGTEIHPPKHKSVRAEKPKPSKPRENVADEEYDSDSIFPRSERLSSYVDKLLVWSVPCFFKAPLDSESECSDVEELLQDDILLEMPPVMPVVTEFSDADLDILIRDLPLPKLDCEDNDQLS